MIQKGIDQCARINACSRMNCHSYRFVHDNQVTVFIENIKRYVFRLRCRFLGFRKVYLIDVSNSCFVIFIQDNFIICKNEALFNQPLHLSARKIPDFTGYIFVNTERSLRSFNRICIKTLLFSLSIGVLVKYIFTYTA